MDAIDRERVREWMLYYDRREAEAAVTIMTDAFAVMKEHRKRCSDESCRLSVRSTFVCRVLCDISTCGDLEFHHQRRAALRQHGTPWFSFFGMSKEDQCAVIQEAISESHRPAD